MDDAHVFGPEFHVLTFHEAISAKPEPLLTMSGALSPPGRLWTAAACCRFLSNSLLLDDHQECESYSRQQAA